MVESFSNISDTNFASRSRFESLICLILDSKLLFSFLRLVMIKLDSFNFNI